MRNLSSSLSVLIMCLVAITCQADRLTQLAGDWRAELASPGGPLPFGLRFAREGNQLNAFLLNGPEEIQVPSVSISGEELTLAMPHYDSRIVARFGAGGQLAGTWRRRRDKTRFVVMDFTARPRQNEPEKPKDEDDFVGRWRVQFSESDDDAVAIFQAADDGHVWSTILTTTGDYRYLATTATGDQLQMSCFDGAHAFLFKAQRQPSGDLAGDFWSRDTWHETWTATRNDTVSLPNAFELTRWRQESSLTEMTFPDLDGQPRSLSELMGRATIVEIFGSWCPNCHDAGQLLSALYDEYHDRGLAVVGLAFELTGDFARDANQVRTFAARHRIRYPSLLVGLADKAKATEQFGALDKIRAYPTFLFVDHAGQVTAIYSGFSGPATGIEHERLTRQFRQHIEDLLTAADKPPK